MALTLRTLLLAAGAATTLSAPTARACDDRPPAPPAVAPAPAPYEPAPPVATWQGDDWHRHDGSWWGRRALEREYRALDRARTHFYRRWGWDRWRAARFDSWYWSRRTELDRRWAALGAAWTWGR